MVAGECREEPYVLLADHPKSSLLLCSSHSPPSLPHCWHLSCHGGLQPNDQEA